MINIFQLFYCVQYPKHEQSAIFRSAIAIGNRFLAIDRSDQDRWSPFGQKIGNCKIKDQDCKNAIFLAIVAFCSKYKVNYCKIAVHLKLNFKVEADDRPNVWLQKKSLDILLDWRKYLPLMWKKKNPSIRLEKKPIRPIIEKIAKKTGDHKATIEIDIADHFSNGVRDRDRNFW